MCVRVKILTEPESLLGNRNDIMTFSGIISISELYGTLEHFVQPCHITDEGAEVQRMKMIYPR